MNNKIPSQFIFFPLKRCIQLILPHLLLNTPKTLSKKNNASESMNIRLPSSCKNQTIQDSKPRCPEAKITPLTFLPLSFPWWTSTLGNLFFL